MREKSSSEFTSLSRRCALRCASSSCSRCAGGSVRASASASSSGPSISVSGVRNSWLTFEKNAVLARSISRQRLCAAAFVLVGARIRDGRRDLGADQLEEARVALVEPDAAADADDQRTGRAARDVRFDRHDRHGIRRIRPRSGRHDRQHGDNPRAPACLALQCCGERPGDLGHRCIEGRGGGSCALRCDAVRADQAQLALCRVDEVEHGERHVFRMLRQDVDGRHGTPRLPSSLPRHARRARSGS